ncbi:helix-turn-helix domain-containing protein [Streptomyces sp. NPDC048385]|uniref:helix-turn-helix domain-containing protein n=1 Tax=unclassified Streptomyces TaxID=2593676 RepID=UPI00344A023A
MESHTTPPRQQPSQVSAQEAADLFLQELRVLKERTGLSLAALAAHTHFSKSSWHRFLNGDKPPPRSAVEALARTAGADAASVLHLWEAAHHAAGRQPTPTADGLATHARGARMPASQPWADRLPRRTWISVTLLMVCLTTAVIGVIHLRPASDRAASALPARCLGKSCEGRLPDQAACNRDARTESTAADSAFTVRLRFSPSCSTVWSEVRARTAEAREVSVRSGQREVTASHTDGTDGGTSPMLAASDPHGVTACAKIGGKLACTGLDSTFDDLDDPPRR